MAVLSFATGVADDADRGLRRAGSKDDAPGLFDLGHSAFAAGVEDDDHEIRPGGGFKAGFDQIPGGQQVGERDDGKVVHQRRAEHGSGCLDGRYAGDDADLEGGSSAVGVLPPVDLDQFEDQSGHAVDAGIAARHQGDGLALAGQADGRPAAIDLLHHGGGDDLLAFDQRPDQVDVVVVPDDGGGCGDGLAGRLCQVADVAGAGAHYIQFCHWAPVVAVEMMARSAAPGGAK